MTVQRETKLFALLVALVATLWGQPAENQVAPQLLVNSGAKWHSPPRAIHATYRYAQVWLVMVYPDGRLAEWGCTLYRDRNTNKIWWAYGESQSVSIGNWTKKSQVVISVSTKLVFADVLRCGDPECKTHLYPEHHEDWSLALQDGELVRLIKTRRGKLIPIQIDPSEIRRFEEAVAAYRGHQAETS